MKRKGFTLIELLVVIAIIGLLSTLSVVSLNSARGRARDAARKSDMNSIATAMELFNVESTDGRYPVCGAVCAINTLANTANSNFICSGETIQTDAGDVVLQAIPAPPTANGYVGFSTTAGYCISAIMDNNNDFFKCINGSCFDDIAGSHCTTISG